jgi:pimeloyl-ACP methyl ester carboxylesterase
MNTSVDGCASWPVPLLGSLDPIRAVGAPDILILGTTNDPATPYEAAVSLSQQMVSAHLVTLDGEGHTAYNRGYTCIDDIVDAYFLRGDVPAQGVTCS